MENLLFRRAFVSFRFRAPQIVFKKISHWLGTVQQTAIQYTSFTKSPKLEEVTLRCHCRSLGLASVSCPFDLHMSMVESLNKVMMKLMMKVSSCRARWSKQSKPSGTDWWYPHHPHLQPPTKCVDSRAFQQKCWETKPQQSPLWWGWVTTCRKSSRVNAWQTSQIITLRGRSHFKGYIKLHV